VALTPPSHEPERSVHDLLFDADEEPGLFGDVDIAEKSKLAL
jgi:hypothetical protein